MNPNYTKYQRTPGIEDLDKNEGVSDMQETFAIDMPDEEITKVLDDRINKSRTFWNDSSNFNLLERRKRNSRFMMGDHWYGVSQTGMNIPYVQNEIYTARQVVSAYVTSRLPELEVMPSQDTPESRRIASNVSAMLVDHAERHDLQGLMCNVVESVINNYIGIIELTYDQNCGINGDIVPVYKDPNNLIIDKRAKQSKNPAFISDTNQNTAEELVAQYPNKKKEIMDSVDDNKDSLITWRKVSITYYQDGKPMEGIVSYYSNVVLAKNKTPHWIYDTGTEGITNVLDQPFKAYVPFNYINDGDHWIDRFGPMDQTIPLQLMVDRIGKQIQQGISHASPVLIFSKKALDKPQADKVTGQPWEKILVDAEDVRTAYGVVQADQVPGYVIQEIERLAAKIHEIFGTPPQLRGESNNNQTATQDIMARNQAQGRMDLLVRAIDRSMDKYFKYLLQMMRVYYTEAHYATVLGEDGRYTFVQMSRDDIEDGMTVDVKAGSTLPMDKSRLQTIALELAKMGKISLLSLYEFLGVPNPGKHVERLIKEQVDAVSVIEDIRNDDQDANAVEDMDMIKANQPAPPRDDVDPNHIRTHQKQLLSNEFLAWPVDQQQAFKAHIQSEIDKMKMLHGITDQQLYPQPVNESVPVTMGGQPPADTQLQPPQDPPAPQPPIQQPVPAPAPPIPALA